MSRRGANWSIEEDKVLCQSYCKISCDGDIGNEQKRPKFWIRIESFYKTIITDSKRSYQSMEGRFKAIGKTCSAWKGALRKANEQRSSGQTEDDVMYMEKAIYMSDMKDKAFEFEHCWPILNQCPKWHSDPSVVLHRPDGRDKQRAQNRGKAKDNYAKDREERRQELLARGARLEERCKNKTLYENHKMERERRKWKDDDENALERRRDKEFDYRERETALYEKDMAVLAVDLSKLTPRKRKIVQRPQKGIYAREAAVAADEDAAEETDGGGDTEEENSIFHDTYRPLNL
ncbi:Glutathione S-transferase T3 [Linum grandiflorum]